MPLTVPRPAKACNAQGWAEGGGEGGIRTLDGLPHTAFPVRRPRPLGDLSAGVNCSGRSCPSRRAMAERAGFEPAVLSHTAFRERHHQPLGHLSTRSIANEPAGPARTAPQPRPLSGVAWWSTRRSAASWARMPDTTRSRRDPPATVRQLDDRAAGTLDRVGQREHETIGIRLEQGPDTHHARLQDAEHRDPRQGRSAESTGSLADGAHDSVGGRVARGPQPGPTTRDHGLIHDGDRSVRDLARRGRGGRLGQRGAHVQLVVHAADATWRR